MIRVVLDHTCVTALAAGDEFLNGLYVEASYGYAELVVPALSAVAAEREKHGAGQSLLTRRFITVEDYTADHAHMGVAWPRIDWQLLHPAATVLLSARAGIAASLLSYTPEAYAGTGVGALDPRE
ncbi:PIN domain-containing protein [Streptomyces sp. NPDC049916]|uniref:PIN domain-containing protein n=1 Tax=Streptomyces sp. NPDC049916 TaxID=3155156 RepID=UPI00343295E2